MSDERTDQTVKTARAETLPPVAKETGARISVGAQRSFASHEAGISRLPPEERCSSGLCFYSTRLSLRSA